MGFLDSLTSRPYAQALYPLLFLTVGSAVAVPPFLFHVLFHPLLYLSAPDPLATARSKFFYFAWRILSPVTDSGYKGIKSPLMTKCYGVVLEIGPGVGDNIKYYNRSQVERLVLVEPNANMHPDLRTKANAAGYFENDASLLLLGCGGAESDELALKKAGVGPESVDSLVSIHVLCGIPRPAAAIEMYRRILKPGGLLVFFEHVRSDQRFAASWQTWYNKVWPHLFDGCCVDRPTGAWIAAGPQAAEGRSLATGLETVNGGGLHQEIGKRWREMEISKPQDQNPQACLPHIMGWAIKA